MNRIALCVALVSMLACGDDDGGGGASCADVCRVASDCGFPIPNCESNCRSMTTPAQRSCVVAAADCTSANTCFTDPPDGGGVTDTGGGGTDTGGGSCRCEGAINGDAYNVACGEIFCADGLERMCSSSATVTETGNTCDGGSCIDQGSSGCSGGMNCCDIPGGTPVCMDDTCCQLNGPATSSSNCCFIFLEEAEASCCVTSAEDSCS